MTVASKVERNIFKSLSNASFNLSLISSEQSLAAGYIAEMAFSKIANLRVVAVAAITRGATIHHTSEIHMMIVTGTTYFESTSVIYVATSGM